MEMWLWGKLVWEWHQNLCPHKTVVWATAVTDVAQPSLSQTPQLSTSAACAVLEAARSHKFCSVWTSNWARREQELGIAGLKYDLKFNFFFLCLQDCLTLSCWYSGFSSWSGGQLSLTLYWGQAWTEAVCEIVRQVDGSTSPVLVMAEYFTDVLLVVCWCQVLMPQLISV